MTKRIVITTTIQPISAIERQGWQESPEDSWQGDSSEELDEFTYKDFQSQPLEQEQIIPFWIRMIVAWIRRRFFEQDHRLPEG